MKRLWRNKHLFGYLGVVLTGALIAVTSNWMFASRIDDYAYDYLFSRYPPRAWTPESLIVAVDEQTFRQFGGPRNTRTILAQALERIAEAHPKAVAVDVILADAGDPAEDARLEAAMCRTHNLVLPCDRIPNGWEDPIPRFRKCAMAVGHVHTGSAKDGVSRQIQLEMLAPGDRRWALSLTAFQQSRGGGPILESPDDVEVGGIRIPAARRGEDRPLRIRFADNMQDTLSVADLLAKPNAAARLNGKTVFLGVTALTGAHDRLITPLGLPVPGVEVHRDAFETIAQNTFLTPATDSTVLLVCLGLALSAGSIFWWRGGWWAYAAAGVVLLAGHSIPALLFRNGTVFPYFAAVSAAWLPAVGSATYRYFTTRRQLRDSESDKARYRQAIHFVTHEMRTPLTAIQGSSELMGRYALNEDKRKQIALMINSESKRLARMIQTFLDVERLSEGQVELKRESFAIGEVVETCLERVRPVAERKQIQIHVGELGNEFLTGDRELMEYAVYNLLTNAVKYSQAETEVWVSAERTGALMRIAVRDQGIGLDAKEIRNVFKKFYRTKKAEASGEVGTGIGLSIVEQIVTEHGGRMEVTSRPGQGSTFTIVVPCHAESPASAASVSKKV